jgi:hypothetical protein
MSHGLVDSWCGDGSATSGQAFDLGGDVRGVVIEGEELLDTVRRFVGLRECGTQRCPPP